MDGSAAADVADRSLAQATRDPLASAPPPSVAILLSTWNGARFIGQQLDSIATQADADWHIYWRDDGSQDDTVALMRRFGAARATEVSAPASRLGVTNSFLLLLRTAIQTEPSTSWFAFADQDDVWLPEKLSRGVAALAAAGPRPALYCARQLVVDANLRPRGPSLPVPTPPGFPASLTQNIATGCTVMLNRPAAELIGQSTPPPLTIHDWWCYLLVSAAGGAVLFDDRPAVLYRQHDGNAVGAPSWWGRRAFAALRRGPSHFMAVFRGHVHALGEQASVLTPANRRIIAAIDDALSHGFWRRLACLAMPGLRRQTWQESLLFRWWFLRG